MPTESVVNVGQVLAWASEVPAALDVTIGAGLPMSLITVLDIAAATPCPVALLSGNGLNGVWDDDNRTS